MGRTPGTDITIIWPAIGTVKIIIGRGLLNECPMEQVEIRRNRGGQDTFTVYLRPTTAPLGYKLYQESGTACKINIGRDRARELGLIPGTYAGAIENGTIIFSLA